MTRIVIKRPLTPMTRHGHKRKGKPVDAWKKDLFQEQDENKNSNDVVSIRGVNLNAIEQIANGVERMMSSWHLDTFERSQKQAKTISNGHETPANNASTTASGRVQSALEKNIACSIVETPAASNATAACERSVGTECHQEQILVKKMAVTEPSFRVVDASTPPHSFSVRENSCSHQSPVVENRIQSPSPTEEPHASTLAHAGVDKATIIDVEAPSVIDHGPDCGAISHYRPCRFETLEVGGRPMTMPALLNGTKALRNKFESLITRTSGAPLIQERPCSAPPEISSVEELQLALIECATEYEIQTLDARTKTQGMKRAISSCDFNQKPVTEAI